MRVHRGVYAVGHEALSDRGRMIAALLAAGPGAALSHETAAHLWGLTPSMPPFIDVSLTDRAPRQRAGLRDPSRRGAADAATQQRAARRPRRSQTIAQLPARRRATAPAPRRSSGASSRATRTTTPSRPAARSSARCCPRSRPRSSPRRAATTPVLGHEADFVWPDAPRRRRDRRLGRPRPPARVRARSRPRRAPPGRRLRHAALHLAPGRRRDAAGRRPDRAGARFVRSRTQRS